MRSCLARIVQQCFDICRGTIEQDEILLTPGLIFVVLFSFQVLNNKFMLETLVRVNSVRTQSGWLDNQCSFDC